MQYAGRGLSPGVAAIVAQQSGKPQPVPQPSLQPSIPPRVRALMGQQVGVAPGARQVQPVQPVRPQQSQWTRRQAPMEDQTISPVTPGLGARLGAFGVGS